MDPARWKNIRRIALTAQELPQEEERAAFLDEACRDDAELRQEVESLLNADLERVSFMENSPIRVLGEVDELEENSQVGAYRVIRKLGGGGMGIVYLATRDGDEFKHEVALKVLQATLQSGQTSEEAEQRFLQEMGILAKLNHPNIAKLHTGGRTEDGRLYYLMEYVEGQRIDVYCREKKLSLKERLRLFQSVCEAVQYAHTHLVIHRDIKPSNVLVTATGEPKLLDFGVAKPLEGAGIGPTVVTGGGQKLFTPDYASPEQIEGDDIHTASDVYSLGILLYELLAGDRPYRLKMLAEKEVLRIVCDETPMPPSLAVLAEVSDSENGSTSTGTTIAAFRRKLEGDLDTIVLMALRKEPAERYATVQQLRDDIERHLVGLPIMARTPSFGYRARKFVRRNRVGLAIAGLFILVIGIAGWALLEQYRKTVQERDRAQHATAFLVDLFKTADPQEMKASELSALHLLGKGGQALLQDDAMEPRVRADLLSSIGSIYGELEMADEALPLHEKALDLARVTFGAESAEYGMQLDQVATMERYLGNTDEAETLYREANRIFDLALGSGPDKHAAAAKNNLAALLLSKSQLEEAEDLFREALRIRSKLFLSDSVEVLEASSNLAATLNMQSKFPEAEALFREVLETRLQLYGPSHRKTGTAFHNLGWNLSGQQRYEEALSYQKKALEASRALFDAPHPSVGRRLTNICLTLGRLKRHSEAEKACRESLSIFVAVYGEESSVTATSVHNLARTVFQIGRLDQALSLCQRGLAGRRATLPPNHPHIVHSLNLIGEIYEAQGKISEAEDLLRDALAQQRSNHSEADHVDILNSLEKLGLLLRRSGRKDEAAPYLMEAADLAGRLFGEDSARVRKLQKELSI